MTPFEAVTQADPYVYYAGLRQQNGLLFDTSLRLWIASSANAVEAVLRHPDCRVRPLNEPVPAAIAQSAAGRVFGRLMRMNEGARHLCPRMAIEPALAAVDPQGLAGTVSRVVEGLDNAGDNLDELMFTLPVCVIASLIGVPPRQLREVAKLTRDFVACLSPLSDGVQLDKANGAATRLSQVFSELLNHEAEGSCLLSALRNSGETSAWEDPAALIANLIGLLSQTCEATAGLIGNSLVALQRQPDLLETLRATPLLAAELVAEVARFDPAVQNTRRFVAKRCTVEGRVLEAGDSVLVLLASANRDPGTNPDPDSFLLNRPGRRTFGFGSGRHECPGRQLAVSIAAEAILAWLHRQPAASARVYRWRYLPSLNGRIPQFEQDRRTQP
ncbi:Cytochrome P450 [Pseudomonas cedrina]|uniref:Cytochrome n=2 Tax=Pseudomonas cedrina TaxID=651740 RepID=A0A1V2KDS7_PSECE|nr:cytochrome P450 [Pseudomonas cedrina]ONH55759.1 cytochrome [Pseudomonas cedrina subsp. cedrina]SDS91834.1 Cytochrome P450 [Pseudomonas cedrina]